jgi:hypothetical protein
MNGGKFQMYARARVPAKIRAANCADDANKPKGVLVDPVMVLPDPRLRPSYHSA